MEWLNYHHLLYFWAVARKGSIAAASTELRLSAPTLSAQIRRLEEAVGGKLLRRSGRRLVLTDVGQLIMPYAEEIFSLGREMVDVAKGGAPRRPLRLAVGIVDVVPKWLAYHLIQPALQLNQRVQIICREDRPERLLGDLTLHELDLVLSDAPAAPELGRRVYNHLLGDCGISFYAVRKLAVPYRRDFPRSLNGAPFLLLSDHSRLRPQLDQWFDAQGIHPRVVGKFDDFAMLRVFAAAGEGIFAAPGVIEQDLKGQYGLERIGHTEAVRCHFYAISMERKIKHPAVVAICETGRQQLFGPLRLPVSRSRARS